MVLDAYGEMLVSANDYDNMYRPIAMTVLAWDNQIILASSQRGPNNFNLEFKESPVYRDLQLCRQVWQIETGKRVDHNSFANCGEPMAAQLYYMLGNQPHLSGKNARMGTVIKSRRTDRPVPQNPCPPPKDQVRALIQPGNAGASLKTLTL
jgi:hypothetical protein